MLHNEHYEFNIYKSRIMLKSIFFVFEVTQEIENNLRFLIYKKYNNKCIKYEFKISCD
jgi:hypothetical protein